MNSLIWPGMDKILATAAGQHRLPYGMSTAANETPETLGPLADGMGWFQLYPPRNPNMRTDMLARAREAGFTTLMVTVDVPVIADAVGGDAKLLLDSGVRSGLDIARAIALGADFVLLGRAFMYGVAALGPAGAAHTIQILTDDLKVNMGNLGCATLMELRDRVVAS